MNRYDRLYILPTRRLLNSIDGVLHDMGDVDLASLMPDHVALSYALDCILNDPRAETSYTDALSNFALEIEAVLYGGDIVEATTIAEEVIYHVRRAIDDLGGIVNINDFSGDWTWLGS